MQDDIIIPSKESLVNKDPPKSPIVIRLKSENKLSPDINEAILIKTRRSCIKRSILRGTS